jgi:4-hydroxybenzoate polyprenyltransferase
MWQKLRITLEMIKFEHSIFALPFALISAVLALPTNMTWMRGTWIIVAMVGARSAAMAFNRIVDRQIDAENPRTQGRALPSGQVGLAYVSVFTLVSSLVFVIASAMLSWLCFWLAFPVLGILFFYSYTKRFTSYSHLVLGFCLGMAPLGAWIALRNEISWIPLLLCLAVTLWTAGFDILYACQDLSFDQRKNLFSIPRRFGIPLSLNISSASHFLVLLILLSLVPLAQLGIISLVGIILVALLLWYEHRLVKPHDLSRLNAAFFTVNGLISLLLFLAISLDRWIRL